MLRGSIVFMSWRLRGQWTTIVLVFVLKLNIASTTQIPHDNVMRFSGDFEGFLKDLGSLVYKKKGVSGNDLHSHYDRYTTPPQKHFRRQNIYNTQKAALGDVLMMKLVSYYEDKYKLTHAEPTTTESITFMSDIVTQVGNKYNVDMADQRPLHQSHENNHLIDQARQEPQPRMDRNRRMERNNPRTYEEPIPEVVIL
ncbi:uncharacterized protein LOC113508361 isoform X1 [Trichoplusia ni]|uniref:Uncharacterized protein LOC113508361 isoform X1 n=1 Tax=Trichoplusia ni TaxID=7111 RepID=A0A7E5X1T8_TRINI|nr:uncharacterized protein LOC113508361 isoform X1 [Trichoplusia ni]